MKSSKRFVSSILIFSMILSGCAAPPKGYKSGNYASNSPQTVNSPCSSSKRDTGALLGAAVGAIIGYRAANDKNKAAGTLLGAGLGGGVGWLIGSELDRRQCELALIQKRHALDMSQTRLTINSTKQGQPVGEGLSVVVVDSTDKPQFKPGSDELQPESKKQFEEIAVQYVPRPAASPDAVAAIKSRHVMLVGHTDDVGPSSENAELSERRAKSVAEVFKNAGVGEDQIYYQGAGETLPIVDNKNDAARARNRRIEIVDMGDGANLKAYAQNRRPNTKLYRPAETAPSNAISILDFGGAKLAKRATPSIGALKVDAGFSLIKPAYAEAGMVLGCDQDRPRQAGIVKPYRGDDYRGSDFLPHMYDSSWAGVVNNHLVSLTHVAVLRDSAALARKPELRIYGNYGVGSNTAKADYSETPEVNVYRGDKAVLYRAFGTQGVRCVDLVIPNSAPMTAPHSVVVYSGGGGELYAASFSAKSLGGR